MIIITVTTNMTREYDDENAIHINTVEDQLTMRIMKMTMKTSTVDKEDKNGRIPRGGMSIRIPRGGRTLNGIMTNTETERRDDDR